MGKHKEGKKGGKFEIKFNPDKRKEFLTGFKKRKEERKKHAQEVAKKEFYK